MLFAWIGFLKAGSEPVSQEVNLLTSDFIAQPYVKIRSVGPLCDDKGHRAGMLMIFETNDLAAAQALVADSPYLKAGLYERSSLHEYRNEAG
ncbi:MAG: YciI family protein [Sphingomicrobium sp.]